MKFPVVNGRTLAGEDVDVRALISRHVSLVLVSYRGMGMVSIFTCYHGNL